MKKMNKKIEGTEMVDNPEHYNQGSLETIEVIEASLGGPTSDKVKGYLTGNVIKYLSRCDYKGKLLEDLKKAQWYLNRLVTNFEDNTPDPS